jgi:hypothetical protein
MGDYVPHGDATKAKSISLRINAKKANGTLLKNAKTAQHPQIE